MAKIAKKKSTRRVAKKPVNGAATVKGHFPEKDRFLFEVLHAIRGVSASEVSRKASYGRGYGKVCSATIRSWRKSGGIKRYPRLITLVAVAKTAGLEFKLLRTNEPIEE